MAQFSGAHTEPSQIDYTFVYVPVIHHSTCTHNPGAYKNEASVYICMNGMMEYCASGNVTKACQSNGSVHEKLDSTKRAPSPHCR